VILVGTGNAETGGLRDEDRGDSSDGINDSACGLAKQGRARHPRPRRYDVAVNGGPASDSYSVYEVADDQVDGRRVDRQPDRTELIYVHHLLSEFPGIVAMGTTLGSRALWYQSGVANTGPKTAEAAGSLRSNPAGASARGGKRDDLHRGHIHRRPHPRARRPWVTRSFASANRADRRHLRIASQVNERDHPV
jgi:hypothetical protein